MQINFHFRRLLKDDIFWSTISIDASDKDREPQHEHKRTASLIVLVIGAYSGGFTYSMDGLAQLQHKDVGAGTCFTAPYATTKFQGAKFTVELHNRHMKRRASGEDLYLLSCLGFARRSTTEPRWNDLLLRSGLCPPSLLSNFFTSLLIEIYCGESSAFGNGTP